jgi:hypothetical protein
MSWETDATAENERDLLEYKHKVMQDYLKQCNDEKYPPSDKGFTSYLLTRMYYEGLPAKEPVDLVVTGSYKVPE